MNKEFPELQKLFEIRGDQSPGDEYFEEFLDEFHRRQRQDLMKRSARSLFAERLTVWFREMGSAKWAMAAGAAYAVLMIGFVVWPKGGTGGDLELPGGTLAPAGTERPIHFEPETPDADGSAHSIEF